MEFLKEYIDAIIFAVLGIMSFLVVWFSIERALFFARLRPENYATPNALEEAASRNLTALYIIYSNAPYIGLLGTVVGIMITFYDMSMAGGMDTKSIMLGLSLALKATALGLLVAIPTLMIYNIFLRKVDVIMGRYCEFGGDFANLDSTKVASGDIAKNPSQNPAKTGAQHG